MGRIRASRIYPGSAVTIAKIYSYLAMLVVVSAVVDLLVIQDPGGLSRLVVFAQPVPAPFWYFRSAFAGSLCIVLCGGL